MTNIFEIKAKRGLEIQASFRKILRFRSSMESSIENFSCAKPISNAMCPLTIINNFLSINFLSTTLKTKKNTLSCLIFNMHLLNKYKWQQRGEKITILPFSQSKDFRQKKKPAEN